MSLYLKKFSTHTEYEQYISGSDVILPNVSICKNENDTHYNPYIEPTDPSTNYEYIEIGGIKWATKNVGALNVFDAGQYFTWGGTTGYYDTTSRNFIAGQYEFYGGSNPNATNMSESEMTKYNNTDKKNQLDLIDDAANINMGSQWRIPTIAEWQNLKNAVNVQWVENYQNSGINCLLCIDKTDSSKILVLPASGYVVGYNINSPNTWGQYLTAFINGNDYVNTQRVWVRNSDFSIHNSGLGRASGYSIRGVMIQD